MGTARGPAATPGNRAITVASVSRPATAAGAATTSSVLGRPSVDDEGLIARFYAGKLSWKDKLVAMKRGVGTMPALEALKSALS